MPGLGFVSFSELNVPNSTFSFDESVCGMLFDTCMYQDLFDDSPRLSSYFGNRQVVLVRNMEDVVQTGLTDTFMNGVPYYHVSQFYDYVGHDADLYLVFADCYSNGKPDFEVIQDIQQAANGRIFQLGIWTEQCIWKSGDYDYEFTDLLGAIETQAEVLSGIVNKTHTDGLPLSIILNACTTKLDDVEGDSINHKKLPNAISLNFPKISVVLGQNGTDKVHAMQSSNHHHTPVGFLGIAMGCLCLASAEMSIGYVYKFNLNKNDNINSPELGFGVSEEDYTLLSELNTVRRNVISTKGYILPTTYKSKESCVFFSNDQTLSERDFSTISLNRLAHKCRRIVRSVMFPYVNGIINIDPSSGTILQTEQTKITNLIIDRLDANMVNPLGQEQISGRYIQFDDTKNILVTDELDLNCYFVPVSSNTSIEIQEAYILNE